MQPEYVKFFGRDSFSLQYFAFVVKTEEYGREYYGVKTFVTDRLHNIYDICSRRYYVSRITSVEYNLDGKIHNEIGPAVIIYHHNGTVSTICYVMYDEVHNEHGPAVIRYHINGKIKAIEYWKNDVHHNEHGPAITTYNSNGEIIKTEFYINGKLTSYTAIF
jgi:antitoxin component YwqK of YwqJK toxin-antitoxin module